MTTADTDTDLPPALSTDARIENYVGIAEEKYTAEQLSNAREVHRAWMIEHGVGDSMRAAGIRYGEMVSAGAKVHELALMVHAAVKTRDLARVDRDSVPTLDRPGGDPGETKKGKRAPKGPPKNRRSTAWVKRLGSSVVAFRVGFGVGDERLLELLHAGSFARRPEEIRDAVPVFGFCPIDDPASSTIELAAVPSLGSDPEYVVWGLRRDHKAGCPTHRFRFEAERDATVEARGKGKEQATTAQIKDGIEARVAEWYRAATPQTTVFPVVYHRPSFTFAVHTDNATAVEEAAKLLRATLGQVDRVHAAVVDAEQDAELPRTDLRSADGHAEGAASFSADLLLWLVGRQLGGTSGVDLDAGRVEWHLESDAKLERPTADGKPIRISLGGAPAEGGSLAAALADGASFTAARITLRLPEKEQEWSATVKAGEARAWRLPTTTKPDGTAEGLDSAIDERLRLWRRGEALFGDLVRAFLSERQDPKTWRQRVTAIRQQLGIALVQAYAFNAETGQGFLFAHMLPGEQGTLAGLKVEDQREKPKRAKRAKGEPTAEAK
jgi:hypothetical protein